MKPIPIEDPAAQITLLSGDAWGGWITRALRAAEKSVLVSMYMVSPHWRVPNRFKLNLLDDLENCARRGLICRAILASPTTIATREAYNATAAKSLADAGWKIRMMVGARLLHEKTMIVDRRISIIGSHNISKASLTSNHDTSVAIESAPVAEAVYRLFWERWRVATKAE